jgi:hypothetical protein
LNRSDGRNVWRWLAVVLAALDWWTGVVALLLPFAVALDGLLAALLLWRLGLTPKKIGDELRRLWRDIAGD